jgi:hypothetical protein
MFCQQKPQCLACPPGKLLAIESIKVECCGGPPCPQDVSTCDMVSRTRNDMDTSDADSLKKAKEACEGKRACKITLWGAPGTDISGIDACSGKSKRATVKYECKGEYVF